MPPRWSRKPDRNDPEYRRLDDRMTFATHVAAFGAVNSGLWFARLVQDQHWVWSIWVTGIWTLALVLHGVYVFAIANYSTPSPTASSSQSPPKVPSKSS